MLKLKVPTWKGILGGIILLSIALRTAAAFYMGDAVEPLPGIFDQVSYHNLALRVLNGYGFSFGETWWPVTQANAPTAHWSYLYTLFLTGVYALAGPHPLAARLIQVVLCGALQPLLAFLTGRQVFNRRVGLAAAFLTAVYAYLVYYAGALMTESFFITAVMGTLYLAVSWDASRRFPTGRAAALGAAVAAGVLLRQLFLMVIPFVFGWLIWSHWKKAGRVWWPSLVLSVLIPLLLILPFTAYNISRFHNFILLNTNAGYAFFWANHPIYGTQFIEILPPEMGDYVSLIPPEVRSLDEASLEKELMKRGIQFILDDPGRYVLLSLSRIPVYFKFWPSADSGLISNAARVASFGLLWPFMLGGLVLAVKNREKQFSAWAASQVFLLLLFTLVYTGIHLLSWALIRYRLPVDAVLIIFSAYCLQELYAWFSLGRKKPAKPRQFLNPAG